MIICDEIEKLKQTRLEKGQIHMLCTTYTRFMKHANIITLLMRVIQNAREHFVYPKGNTREIRLAKRESKPTCKFAIEKTCEI